MSLTIKDIADLAGVSVTTVSRVMNHRPDVSEATRQRVSEILRDTHFVGNASARMLKQAMPRIIPVILHGHNNPFLQDVAESLLQMGQERGLPLVPFYIGEHEDEVASALRITREQAVQGLIMVGSSPDERGLVLKDLDIPVVFSTVSTKDTPLSFASSVSIDDQAAFQEAAGELIRLGHRNFSVFGCNPDGEGSMGKRLRGIQNALSDAGLHLLPEHVVPTDFSFSHSKKCALDFFPAHPDISCVLCMSDVIAIGVIRALWELGISVPDQISVLGVDALELGQAYIPKLSSVAQDTEVIAAKTLELLVPRSDPVHVEIPARILWQESTGCNLR